MPAGKAEKTSIVRLEWEVGGWAGAPAALVAALARHAREGLPRRYGDVEPFQHTDPAAFAAFAQEHDTGWLASRPFFGGSAHPEGRLGLDVYWRVLRADERWREAQLSSASCAASL